MSRALTNRYVLKGTLVAETPLHIGGFDSLAGDIDLPVMRDGADRIVIPGTSLAGPIRSWIRSRVGGYGSQEDDTMRAAWGSLPGLNNTQTDAAASRITVSDAPVSEDVSVEIRDHVGIDRATGAAASGIKYTRMIVPVGARFPFKLEIDTDGALLNDATAQALLATLARDLAAGSIRFGGAKTRGLGELRLCGAQLTVHHFSDRVSFLKTLMSGDEIALDRISPTEHEAGTLRATATWRPLGAMLIGAGADGITIDKLPLVTSVGNELAFVIPWSSIKGVLRSHAERIVRTLQGTTCVPTAGSDSTDAFLAQIDVPIVNTLFGSAKNSVGGLDHIGAISGRDVLSTKRITDSQWHKITHASGKDPNEAMTNLAEAIECAGLGNGATGRSLQPAMHVAIDRWTGGSVDQKLFSELEVHVTAWAPIEIQIDIARLRSAGDSVAYAALMLLMFVLRDLNEGWLAFGSGGAKGHGAVHVESLLIDTRTAGSALVMPPTGLLGEFTPPAEWLEHWTNHMSQQGSAA